MSALRRDELTDDEPAHSARGEHVAASVCGEVTRRALEQAASW